MSTNNLANQLSTRFRHRGNAEDLDEAIALQREVLALCPVGNAEDLDEAIALQREALALCPFGHTDRSKPLNNLAAHLFTPAFVIEAMPKTQIMLLHF
ncbi:hypothetical protein DFJ58DRAFT_736793 [Suillus subalutaceus]|uniref:uncharacterized protein n=1 Tax=Suillus subalutaceus TaxID=48586 RepID=UPI001B870497|nr:uncharacterized protein DFJ58DRAFT_736793 [Suillus subalutaceus]KAG1830981.1 hypothetical protein DFJ58DRAFT_736793 [Suillus subalutaceus]